MKKLLFLLTLLAFSNVAEATCFGSGNFYSCNDTNGNSYTVNKFGNNTQVNGYNSRTGSRWNANSQQFGNTTITNGTAANGNTWNSTTHTLGNTTYTSGRDSNGKSFNSTCMNGYCY